MSVIPNFAAIGFAEAPALAAAGAVAQLAGRPGEHEAPWRQAGVKDFVYLGCDVLATLQAAHAILRIASAGHLPSKGAR
jgi:methylmalonyl-CoA mutase